MQYLVSEIIESLLSPAGRFKRLEGVVLDQATTAPTIELGGAIASFRVRFKERPYLLRCVLSRSAPSDGRLAEIAGRLQSSSLSSFVGYQYLPEELLLFDERGQGRYIDVGLHELPDGESLVAALGRYSARADRCALREMVEAFATTANELLQADLVHGRLKSSSFWVTPQREVKIVGYEGVCFEGDAPFAERSNRDNLPLSALMVGLILISQRPALYGSLQASHLFRGTLWRTRFWELFSELAERMAHPTLQTITRLMVRSGASPQERIELAEALLSLAKEAAQLPTEHLDWLQAELQCGGSEETPLPLPTAPVDAPTPTMALSRAELQQRYHWVSRQSEGVRVVERDALFGVVDELGEEIIPLLYDNIDDFTEGRAVVIEDDLFGLLNKQGELVLPISFESIDWYCEEGVATIFFEGRGCLVDRDGKHISDMSYTWMGTPSEGMIQVQREGLYGYINLQGAEVIAPQFEETFDFEPSGEALVRHKGELKRIDLSGGFIE